MKLATQFRAGVAGVLAWDWNLNGSTLGDFDIGPNDPALHALATRRRLPRPAAPAPAAGTAG